MSLLPQRYRSLFSILLSICFATKNSGLEDRSVFCIEPCDLGTRVCMYNQLVPFGSSSCYNDTTIFLIGISQRFQRAVTWVTLVVAIKQQQNVLSLGSWQCN